MNDEKIIKKMAKWISKLDQPEKEVYALFFEKTGISFFDGDMKLPLTECKVFLLLT